MKKLLLIFFVLSFVNISYGSDTYRSLTDMNFDWYKKNYTKIETTLKHGTEQEAIPIINTLCLIWKHRDGGIWIEVSPAFNTALLYKTRLLLLWFSEYPEEYTSLLQRFPTAMFTAWNGSDTEVTKMKKLKVELINTLRDYVKYESDDKLRENCNKLIYVLENTIVRKID